MSFLDAFKLGARTKPDSLGERAKLAASSHMYMEAAVTAALYARTIDTRAKSMVPRPYQVEGITFLRKAKRAILADAPGLGKTFQSCEAAVLPALVSCPLTLVEQWAEFIHEQYPEDSIYVAAYGDRITRDAVLKAYTSYVETGKTNAWLIVNHDMWRTYYMPDATTLIVDEFHNFRNRSAARCKTMRTYVLKRQSLERVYGLTATPVFKDVGDLWHQLHMLDPKEWSSYWNFLARYAYTTDYGYGTKILKIRNKEILERNTAHLMLGRTYKQVGMFLPERIDKDIVLKMDAPTKKRYTQLRDQYRLEFINDLGEQDSKRFFNAGAILHELRKLTVTPEKLAAVKEIIEDTLATYSGDTAPAPIVVFTWYKDTAQRVVNALGGPAHATLITGDVNPAERKNLARIGGEHNAPVRVATMESLSVGVDLSDARTVIYIEETYVPGQQYQSIARVIRHRTAGEADDAPVIAYWVRYAGTVDEVVHRTVRSRIAGNALTVLQEALAS